MMEAPPLIDLAAPRMRNAPAEVRATFSGKSRRGHVHPMVDELIAEGIGIVDDQGQLVVIPDETRFLAFERTGKTRRVFRVTHCVARDLDPSPAELVVYGVDMTKLLALVPSMSAPMTWTGEWTTFTRDWVGPEGEEILFDQPRDLAGMQMVTVADGATVEGPAEETIRRLVAESLEAMFRVVGVEEDPPIVVDPTETGVPSPRVLIRPTDGPLLEEIMPTAMAAGVVIGAWMWWPGDDPVADLDLSQPTVVVDVRQTVEVEE